MSFHFRCPSGHLLQAEDQDVGQIVNCPVCGTAMAIPANPAGPPTATPVSPNAPVQTASISDYSEPLTEAVYEEQEVESFPDVTGEKELDADEFNVDAGGESHGETEDPDFDNDNANCDELHIACPNGHVLVVTRDLLHEEAICPHCNVSFELLERNSIEAKTRKAEQAERRAEKVERVFLYWGIAIAVLVIGGIIGLTIAYGN